MKIISLIKEGDVIDKILDHLQYKFEVLPLPAVLRRLTPLRVIPAFHSIRVSGPKGILQLDFLSLLQL